MGVLQGKTKVYLPFIKSIFYFPEVGFSSLLLKSIFLKNQYQPRRLNQ